MQSKQAGPLHHCLAPMTNINACILRFRVYVCMNHPKHRVTFQ